VAEWSPAVEQGKPIILEDLDHAPREMFKFLNILGRSGMVPVYGKGRSKEGSFEYAKAADGFQMLATVTTSGNSKSEYAEKKNEPGTVWYTFNKTINLDR